MPKLTFQAALSIEEWWQAGRELGLNCRQMKRSEFEKEVAHRTVALENLFKSISDEAIAAFDQGAWSAWELGEG